jgi:adenylate cyclase
LSEWSKPEKRTAVPSVFTFMFTDIVGSTAMTHAIGNANAQKVVRAHNTAVRNAIAKYKGREVKHTGDGIMGVFFDSPSSVNACVEMQRDIANHNARNKDLPLVVRIGLNAGEAVEEENDFFGAAVQMSARVCSKANDGHVWVSQSVVDACKGQRLGFIPRGKFEMKGIQGARTLYEVAWTDAHKNELADL